MGIYRTYSSILPETKRSDVVCKLGVELWVRKIFFEKVMIIVQYIRMTTFFEKKFLYIPCLNFVAVPWSNIKNAS